MASAFSYSMGILIKRRSKMSNYYVERSPDYLEHHGILGQKWGIRRFQNPDGSLTEEGRRRYGDILTPDQMKNMIRSYNLRTGKNKKINKKTTFKTSHGTYDYKGKRIDTDTDVNDPGQQKKTYENKKPSEMTDEELKTATERMRNERLYKEEYAKNNPAPPKTAGEQLISNLKDHLIEDIPAGISSGVKQYLSEYIKSLATGGSGNNNNNSNQQNNQQNNQQPKPGNQQQNQPKQQPKPNNQQNRQQNNSEKPTDSKKGENVADKVSNAMKTANDKTDDIAKTIGKVQDAVSSGVKDIKKDTTDAYNNARNTTQNNRMGLLERALNDAGFSSTRSSGAYGFIKNQIANEIKNDSGRKFDSQDYYNNRIRQLKDGYYTAQAEAQIGYGNYGGSYKYQEDAIKYQRTAAPVISQVSNVDMASLPDNERISSYVDAVREELRRR